MGTSAMKGQERDAELLQTLVFYMEPQLLLLRSANARNVFAVAVPHENMCHPFFTAEVRENVFNRYMDGKADLNFVLRNAAFDKYYLFDLGEAENGNVRMRPIAKSYAEENELFPEPGIFSRSHTHIFKVRQTEGLAVHRFGIDGNWQANDFSHFNAKIANLYGLFSVLRRLDADSAGSEFQERSYMKRLVRDRFWRGGGSYLGFYDDLYDHIRNLNSLEVESIIYQSPGQIVFRGDALAFAEIDQIIEVFPITIPN
jgi:hypothetical protein